jgi:hypothetical protein
MKKLLGDLSSLNCRQANSEGVQDGFYFYKMKGALIEGPVSLPKYTVKDEIEHVLESSRFHQI